MPFEATVDFDTENRTVLAHIVHLLDPSPRSCDCRRQFPVTHWTVVSYMVL